MATFAPLELMFTIRPAGPCLFLSVPKRGAKAWITTSGDHVGFQLPLVLAGLQIKQWPTHHNSCIVHQANQIPVAYHGADLLGGLMYSVGVRNVHYERHETVTEIFLQTIGVSLLAYGTEHANSLRNKHLCGSPTNSGGNPGDHDIFAVRQRISPKMITVHLQHVRCTPSLVKV